ncbi:cytidine deaminase [Patescibacteria group bacterium]|nr:cytidine deaminase [Patescibacteria group bacterium]
MAKRISWDELFMSIVRLYSQRSACKYLKVGVIFVKENRILCAGYNGPPRHEPHCIEVGCAKEDEHGKKLPAGSGLCRGAHAEMNAMTNANIQHVELNGSAIYCTFSPCNDCAKHLTGLRIEEFVYEKEYKEKEGQLAIQLLKRRGVKVRQFKLRKETKT